MPVEEPLVPRDVYARIRSAAASKSSPSVYWRDSFRALAEGSRAIYAQFAISAGVTVAEDYWHTGPTSPDFWKPTVSAVIDTAIGDDRETLRVFKAKQSGRFIAILVAPLHGSNDACIGAAAVVLEVDDAKHIRRRLSELAAACTFISFMAGHAARAAASAPANSQALSGAAMEKLTSAHSLHELAFAISNNLCNRLGCEQVAIGTVRHHRVRMLAISGFDHITHRNPGVRAIAAAMEEAADHGSTIICQNPGEWDADSRQPEYRLHRQWRAATHGAAVASIPFMANEQCVAVLSLRAMHGATWDAETLDKVEEQVAPYAAGLDLVERAHRGIVSHAVASSLATVKAAVTLHSWPRRLGIAAVLMLACWIAFGSGVHRVTVPCRIRPAVAQRLYAPYAGIVRDLYVKAGDQVKEGQLLFSMDSESLIQERRYLEAQINIAQITMKSAMVVGDATAEELQRSRIEMFEAKQSILDRQLDRSQMHAPYDGIVTVGDPNLIEDQMLAIGDPIVEVIPLSDWLVELEVPEDSITALRAGLSGRLSLNARADASQTFVLTRLLPQAHQRAAGGVFIAEGSIEGGAIWLRAGMEGTARVEIGRKPIWWIVSHRAIRTFQRTFWI